MIIAKNGVIKVSGYTSTIIKEGLGVIDSLLESDVLGNDIKSKEAMLSVMISVVKSKISGNDPVDFADHMSKEEVKAFIRLMSIINSDGEEDEEEADDDDDDAEEQQTEDSNNEAKGKVTVICGGKKVVTDADGIGKIIADMVADEIKNNGKEKK